ncbi:lysophospholipid acyltransferase family protein [Persicobacter diffluens]|uniref:Acetyltransferase n=1 Tax=Persicobacter diffluens TaxID=981 RepID=A0AAN4VVL5_9BACT|nr:acetyltransferase [Persicobacter diffluens]
MQQFIYRFLFFPFFYLISLIPLRIMYLFSDCFYFVTYYLIGYRKKVVLDNLHRSFPEKSPKEIKAIARKHYRFFTDSLFETLKKLSISEKELRRRVEIEHYAEMYQLYKDKHSIIVVMGHYGSWELGGARIGLEEGHPLICIYKPLHNKMMDQLFLYIRTRFRGEVVATKNTPRVMLANRNRETAIVFLADQTPLLLSNSHWVKFLNQDTPVYRGTAQLAQKFDYPVVYAVVRRPKRGYYKVSFEVLTMDPKSLSDLEISRRHTRRLEEDIIAQPELWMWTHRRWKRAHQKPKDVQAVV